MQDIRTFNTLRVDLVLEWLEVESVGFLWEESLLSRCGILEMGYMLQCGWDFVEW